MHWCVTLRFILVVGDPLKCIHFPVITAQVGGSVIVVATDLFDHVDFKRRGRHTHTVPGRNHAPSALALPTLESGCAKAPREQRTYSFQEPSVVAGLTCQENTVDLQLSGTQRHKNPQPVIYAASHG